MADQVSDDDLRRAREFYARSPDGQWDGAVVAALDELQSRRARDAGDKSPPAASQTAEDRARRTLDVFLEASGDETQIEARDVPWFRDCITDAIRAAESVARAERDAEVERLTDRVKMLEEDRAGHAAEVAQLRAQLAARSPARDRAAEACIKAMRGWFDSNVVAGAWSKLRDEASAALRALDAEAGGITVGGSLAGDAAHYERVADRRDAEAGGGEAKAEPDLTTSDIARGALAKQLLDDLHADGTLGKLDFLGFELRFHPRGLPAGKGGA